MRSLAVLAHRDHRIGQPVSAHIATRMASMIHALHELQQGVPPTGQGQLLFSPHNHIDGNGVSIPRGTLCCYDFGEVAGWTVAGGPGVWLRCNLTPTVNPAMATIPANDLHPANLRLYVTPGIDSTITAVSGNPCVLEAQIYLDHSTATGLLRVRNRYTGTYSSQIALAAGAQWVHVTDIPCAGGRWQDLDVEIRDTAAIFTCDIYSVTVAEIRTASQPASNGAWSMTTAPKP